MSITFYSGKEVYWYAFVDIIYNISAKSMVIIDTSVNKVGLGILKERTEILSQKN